MAIDMGTAATTSTGAGYNCLQNSFIKESQYPRQVKRIGFAGSAVAGDIYFDLFYGTKRIGTFYPATVGAAYPTNDNLFVLSGGEICPAGVELRLIANASATTNSVFYILETSERTDLRGMRGGRY